MSLGPLEIILIVAVIALIFGARKLPELGKGVGQGIREFKKEVKDDNVTDVSSRQLDASRPVPSGPVQSVSEPAVQNPNERR